MKNVQLLDAGARPMIHHMMTRGLQVDLSHFERMSKTLADDMDRVTEDVRTMTGMYCNLGSGDQVANLLFKTLGLKQARPKFTPTGDRESVENEVLVAIQHDHPVVPKILDFKELEKLKGTYVDPMPKLAQRVNNQWRMMPKLGDTRVPSGRLNCKEPNLLAMPNRTARGRQVCEGFITDPGWCYLSVDESQIEPRVVAHRSQDPNLQAVYHNEEDIYSDFAIAAFKLPDQRYQDTDGWHYPGVDKKVHRFPAKTCTLASIYEVSGKGLLEQMPIVCKHCYQAGGLHNDSLCPKRRFSVLWTEESCSGLIMAFYQKYPGILAMRTRDHRRALRYGYLWDDWGRILHTVGVRSVLKWVVSAVLREAGNFPVQSTAQGTVKLAMASVYDDMVNAKMFDVAHPLLQVHDELLFECRVDVRDEIAEAVKYRFETCVKLDIPIKAGVAYADCWGKMPK